MYLLAYCVAIAFLSGSTLINFGVEFDHTNENSLKHGDRHFDRVVTLQAIVEHYLPSGWIVSDDGNKIFNN